MPVAWFICTYKRKPDPLPLGRVIRYCPMADFNQAIRAGGGAWAEIEVLGQRTIVKVRASAQTLTTIAGTPGFMGLRKAALTETLSDLTDAQRDALRQLALDCGYSGQEVNAAFPGGLANVMVGELLRFLAQRKREIRYDAASDTIIDDGPVLVTESIDDLDARVR